MLRGFDWCDVCSGPWCSPCFQWHWFTVARDYCTVTLANPCRQSDLGQHLRTPSPSIATSQSGSTVNRLDGERFAAFKARFLCISKTQHSRTFPVPSPVQTASPHLLSLLFITVTNLTGRTVNGPHPSERPHKTALRTQEMIWQKSPCKIIKLLDHFKLLAEGWWN